MLSLITITITLLTTILTPMSPIFIKEAYAQQQQAPTVTSRLTIPLAANTTLVVEKGSDGTETKHILIQDQRR